MKLRPASIYADWLGTDGVIVTDGVINSLTLRITNISGELITAGRQDRINLYFPVGNEEYNFTTVENAKAIECVPPYDWDTEFEEDSSTWIIAPAKSMKLESGEGIVVVFKNIVTEKEYPNGSMSCLNISFQQEEDPDLLIRLPIFMNNAPVKIKKFTGSHSMVGVLDDVTFCWETMGGEKGVYLLPDFCSDVKSRFKAVDQAKCTVMETTDYSLMVSNGEDTVIEHCPVCVFEPKINEFTYEQFGNQLVMNIVIENTCHCYVDCGVGRIECIPDYSEGYCIAKGTFTVAVNEDIGAYKVSCLGENGLVQKLLKVPYM